MVPVPPASLPPTSGARWRLLFTEPASAVDNMALDAGLMDRAASTGESVLRLYSWATPSLSFGRNETVVGLFDPTRVREAGFDVVRRPTGGRVLLHDHEATYSVAAPVVEGDALGRAYERINALLVRALEQLGVEASTAPSSPVRRPGGAACFAEPNAGELVVDGRKLVGSAQVRERGAMLQHGSILFADDQPRIAEVASRPMTPSIPAATLSAILGRWPGLREVYEGLRWALEEREGPVAILEPEEAWRWAAPHRERFASMEWTWRR